MLETHNTGDEKIRSGLPFKDILKIMAKPEKDYIQIIIIYTAVISLLSLVIPVSVQSVVNNLGVRHMIQPIIIMSTAVVIILCFAALLSIFQMFTIEKLKRRLFIRFGAVITERLLKYEEENYKKNNTLALMNRYFDVLIAQSSMVVFLVDGAAFFLQAILGLLLLVSYHPYFIGFGIIIAILIYFDWKLFGPNGIAAGTPEGNGKYNVVALMEDIGRTRQHFMSEKGRKFAMDRLGHVMEEWLGRREKLWKEQFAQGVGLQIIYAFVYGGLIFLGGMLVLKKELSLGQLVAATIVVSLILSNINRLQNFFLSIYEYSTSLDQMALFYDHPLERLDDHLPAPVNYEYQFKDVTLKPNFKFNFKLEAQKKYFVYIGSFSGKDNLIELVNGFIKPEHGKVYIDNTDINDFDLAKIRNEIEVVTLNNFFNGTILENLSSFDKKVFSKTEIERALDAVGLLENIQEFPEGVNTIIQPNGYPLSTSQLIAIHFAKIILHKPKFLIVTNDFERISEVKRRKILPLITDKNAPWTLLFFSQKRPRASLFDKYAILRRQSFEEFNDYQSMEIMVEKYEQDNYAN